MEDEKLRVGKKRRYATIEISLSDKSAESSLPECTEVEDSEEGSVPSIQSGSVKRGSDYSYKTNTGVHINNCKPIDVIMNGNGDAHTLTRFVVIQMGSKQKRRARVQQCRKCGKETTMFCNECGVSYCYSRGNNGHGRKCFQRHIPARTCVQINSSP